jgi:hypothetical protein
MKNFYKIAAILLLFLPIPAHAQTMVYSIYAGGLHAVDAQLEIDTHKGRYDIMLQAATRGFLSKLVPWRGTFETHGWSGINRPQTHKSATVDSDGETIKEYRYTKDGGFKDLTVTENGKGKIRKTEPELSRGTIDTLTAAMKVLQDVAQGKKCEGQSDIFDGRRRFTQVFHPAADDEIEATSYNAYAGPALVCVVEVIPKGGAWHKKPRGWMSIQEQGRKAGALPTLWVAQLEKGGPAVPVKLQIKTSYGTLMMHLAEYKNGDKMITAERRK